MGAKGREDRIGSEGEGGREGWLATALHTLTQSQNERRGGGSEDAASNRAHQGAVRTGELATGPVDRPNVSRPLGEGAHGEA